MNKIYSLLIIVLLTIFISCSNKIEIKEIKIGNNYDNNGVITDTNLNFHFHNIRNINKYEDVFNSIYFAGDTLCFSILFNKTVKNSNFKSYYITGSYNFLKNIEQNFLKYCKIPNKARIMERVDVLPERISGFSLVGSILENTYKDRLSKKADIKFLINKSHYVLYLFVLNNKCFSRLIKYRINIK